MLIFINIKYPFKLKFEITRVRTLIHKSFKAGKKISDELKCVNDRLTKN